MMALEDLDAAAVFGELAIASIMRAPPGPARDREALRFVADVDHVVVTCRSGEDFIDAHARLMVAIARLRGEA